MKPKFNLGRVVATPGALSALSESGQSPAFFLDRHIQGDWGDLCDAADDDGNRASSCLLLPQEY